MQWSRWSHYFERGGGKSRGPTWRSRRPRAGRDAAGGYCLRGHSAVPGVRPISKVPRLTIAPAAVTRHRSSSTTDSGVEAAEAARKGLSDMTPLPKGYKFFLKDTFWFQTSPVLGEGADETWPLPLGGPYPALPGPQTTRPQSRVRVPAHPPRGHHLCTR